MGKPLETPGKRSIGVIITERGVRLRPTIRKGERQARAITNIGQFDSLRIAERVHRVRFQALGRRYRLVAALYIHPYPKHRRYQ